MTLLLHIADRVMNRPLMILPDKLWMIASILDGRIGIDGKSLGDIEALKKWGSGSGASRFVGNFELIDPKNPAAGRKPYRTTSEGVAIIQVLGSLVNRGGWLDAMSGITSYEKLKFQIGAAARDSSVSSIILDMDSPGGEAIGAFEAGDVVREAAQVKEVVAVVNGMAASAAYAIASAATRIVTTSSGISGSIGVVMLHADYSKRLETEGVKPTLIYAGARKVDGNPYERLSPEVKAELSAEINRFYDLFVSSVAVGRKGMTEQAIRGTEAKTYIGTDAVAVGLADAVGSFESVLSGLSATAISRRSLAPPRQEPIFTRADLDRARAEGRAQGLSESLTDGGLTAALARIEAVTTMPEAQGRQQFARHIALQPGISIEEIRGALKHCPTEAAALRAGQSPFGLVVVNNRGK